MLPVELKVSVDGSNNSAVARTLLLLSIPPVIRTLPELSNVAVWFTRGVAMLPVTLKPWANIWIVKAWDPVWPNWSCAVTVMGSGPVVAVGVPDSTPSVPNAKPAGNAPVLLHVSGGYPWDAVKAKLYGRLIAPAGGSVVLTIGGGGGLIVMV